jgi:hypothetical protein
VQVYPYNWEGECKIGTVEIVNDDANEEKCKDSIADACAS